MTQGLKPGEKNGRDVYPDIIDHSHWQSPTRTHMSLYDRAAQFSAFDALAGYTDMVKEEQRETNSQSTLSESALEILNQKLNLIADVIEDGTEPELTITYFVPDSNPLKSGGSYVTVTDTVKKVDVIGRQLVLMSTEGYAGLNKAIAFECISEISGELVDYIDDWE